MDIGKFRIHIAPVGYEIDRIVIPAKNLKADKVYLLIDNKETEDKAKKFIIEIEAQLKKAKIRVEKIKHDRQDLFDIIRTVKEIIIKENRNDVFVNLASGSKMQAIASMMASMMFNENQNVQPFYAEAEDYAGFRGQISTGVKKMTVVPTYQVHIPKPKLIQALKMINERGGKIQKKEMVRLAVDHEIIEVKEDAQNQKISKYASLDKNILNPLQEQWKFIDVKKTGRTRLIKLTEEGKNAIKFL